jgi:hypothetical protein
MIEEYDPERSRRLGRYGAAAIVLLAASLSGCYSVQIVEYGPGEQEEGRRPGKARISLVAEPSPSHPIARLYVDHRPILMLRRGTQTEISLAKRPQATIAVGVGLQWWATLLALRDASPFKRRAAIGINVLGLATLLTRGSHGGYVGWLLPDRITRSFLSKTQLLEREAEIPESVAHGQLSLECPQGVWRRTTDAQGQADFHLVSDLGLVTFVDDHPILVSAQTGDATEILVFLPSDFLYSYYRFPPETRIYPPAGADFATQRDTILAVTGKDHLGRHVLVGVAEGQTLLASPTAPHFERYGPLDTNARIPVLRVSSVRAMGVDGLPHLVRGQSGQLVVDLFLASGQRTVNALVQVTGNKGLLIAPPVNAKALRAGRQRTIIVPLEVMDSAQPGRHRLSILVSIPQTESVRAQFVAEITP